jgi:endonuclease YncB( thermonuclease family)
MSVPTTPCRLPDMLQDPDGRYPKPTPPPPYAPDNGVRRAYVTSVHDGDTFTADIEVGGPWGQRCEGIRIRIKDERAPELKEPGGLAARDALKALCLTARVDVLYAGKDSFDRHVCECWFNGKTLQQRRETSKEIEGIAW